MLARYIYIYIYQGSTLLRSWYIELWGKGGEKGIDCSGRRIAMRQEEKSSHIDNEGWNRETKGVLYGKDLIKYDNSSDTHYTLWKKYKINGTGCLIINV